MKIDLTGKNMLVTGASRGIGKAIAASLAESGARVAIHYHVNRNEAEKLAGELGNGSEAFGANLSDAEACIGLFREVTSSFKKIDVLVNNAGIAMSSPLNAENHKWLTDWDRTMAVNLTAVGVLSREAVHHFSENGGGRLIHVSSRAAFRGDTPEYMAYAASKGGIVSLSRTIARHFGKKGIKSFIIAPGFIRTDMARDFIDEYGEDFVLNDIALSKLTEPADLAPMIVLLASGLADHATGCTIDVNAGSYVH